MPARTHRPLTRAALLLTALCLATTACSDDTGTAAATTTTAAGATTTTAARSQPACPTASTLKVTQGQDVTEVRATSAYAIVSSENGAGTIDLTITNAPIDEAGARSTDDPTLTDGQAEVRMHASNVAGDLTVGTYNDFASTNGDGRTIDTSSVYTGAGRILPTEDHRLELTEITADHVCGRIVPNNDDAAFYGSTFVAKRIAP